jgi:hypothetical protein
MDEANAPHMLQQESQKAKLAVHLASCVLLLLAYLLPSLTIASHITIGLLSTMGL